MDGVEAEAMMKQKHLFRTLLATAGLICLGLACCREVVRDGPDQTQLPSPHPSLGARETPTASIPSSPEPTQGEGSRLRADRAALENLFSLRGNEYMQAREALLDEHPDPFDIEMLAARSWKSGLMAFLLESRRLQPELHRNWDNDNPGETAAGTIGPHVALEDPAGLAFCIEYYLFARQGEMGGEILQALVVMPIGGSRRSESPVRGPVSLWMEIWRNAPDEGLYRDLRLVALRGIAADVRSTDSELFELIKEVWDSRIRGNMRGAIYRGIMENPTTAAAIRKALEESPAGTN